MGRNKNRRRGGDPAFPRLLGERLCLDYVNTVESPLDSHPREHLLGYPDLVRWGGHVGVLDAAAADQLLQAAAREPDRATVVFGRARALREALTRIFRAIARGNMVEEADLGHLRAEYLAALGPARLAPTAGGYGWAWDVDDESLDRPLWAVARSAVEVLTTGELVRVKECSGAGDCGWLFYDTSKNHSRRWCSMEGCGSRVKMRQQYARAHAQKSRLEMHEP